MVFLLFAEIYKFCVFCCKLCDLFHHQLQFFPSLQVKSLLIFIHYQVRSHSLLKLIFQCLHNRYCKYCYKHAPHLSGTILGG